MSVATIGAVGLTDTDLIIPGVPQIPYALLLTGAGSTTEVIEVRSLQRGGHVYVTRGAFGSLPVAHTAPVVVTLYDPNSGGGGGGGGVTVEVPPAAPVAVTNIIASGASISGSTATLVNTKILKSALITKDTPNLASASLSGDYPLAFSVSGGDLAIGDVILEVWADVLEFFDGPDNAQLHIRAQTGADLGNPDWNFDLFSSAPDLAYSSVQDNINSPANAGLGIADGATNHGLLDVRSNYTASPSECRLLPAVVLTSGLEIRVFLTNGTTWTQGQMYIYALVASPTS